MVMTNKEIESALISAAASRIVPILKGEKAYPEDSWSAPGQISETYWEHGIRHVREDVIHMGADPNRVDEVIAELKMTMGGHVLDDFIALPEDLLEDMNVDYEEYLADEAQQTINGPDGLLMAIVNLDERRISDVEGFRVEMFSNESQHAGRPHVKVYVGGNAISVSLNDDPPEIIASPNGKLQGQDAAVHAVAKHRLRLLRIWYETRPEDQKLKDHAVRLEAARNAYPNWPLEKPAKEPTSTRKTKRRR